jgi:hypothetical protein
MTSLLIGIAAVIVGAPIVATIIVAVASRREDKYWTLDQPARTQIEATARRIVALDVDSIKWPRSKAQVQAQAAAATRSQWPYLVPTEELVPTEDRNAS